MVKMQASRYAIIPVAEAQRIISLHTPSLGIEEISLYEAEGRTLAEDVVADIQMPPFATTTVDGYAIIAADGLMQRRVMGEVSAGHSGKSSLRNGEALRIMTGAPLPQNADAIAMVEHVVVNGDYIQTTESPSPGDGILPRGIDLQANQNVLAKHMLLGAAEIGLLATVGRSRVSVYRRPVVAVLSTGDELVEPHDPLGPGSIRDSNRYALLASVADAGGIPLSFGAVRDDELEQRRRIEEALEAADVLLTSGGVSVGSRDLIKPIFEQLGTVHFGRVSVRPGKPLTFATFDSGKLAFGLPGFPVSSLVTFEVFVRPTLLRMQGRLEPDRPWVRVKLKEELTPTLDRTDYQRAIVRWVEGELTAYSTGRQVSSRIMSMIGANALVRVPPGGEPMPAGSLADAMLTAPIQGNGSPST